MDTLHPFAIHLPLALVFLWPVVDGLGLWLDSPHLRRLGVGLLVVAALTSLFATATGQAAFDEAVRRGIDPELLRSHGDDADLVPWMLLGILAVRAWLPTKLGRRGHAVALALGVAAWPFVIGVGQSGGALVYRHGVGVWLEAAPVDGAPPKR